MRLLKIKHLLFVLLLSVSCKEKQGKGIVALPYYNDPTFTPQWLDENSKELSSFHKIPDFSVTNQLGKEVTSNTFKDKIYVADFFFTSCPSICPKMTTNMSVLQEAFIDDKEVLLLSYSVTPTTDTVAVLKQYGDTYNVNPTKWHLVTGSRTAIYELGRNAYFVDGSDGVMKTEEDFLHTESFVLVDKNQYIRGIYNGLEDKDIKLLIHDIQKLKNE